MDKAKLADMIINYRAENDLTQEQFAKLVGLSVTTIFNMENQVYHAKKVNARKIQNLIERG